MNACASVESCPATGATAPPDTTALHDIYEHQIKSRPTRPVIFVLSYPVLFCPVLSCIVSVVLIPLLTSAIKSRLSYRTGPSYAPVYRPSAAPSYPPSPQPIPLANLPNNPPNNPQDNRHHSRHTHLVNPHPSPPHRPDRSVNPLLTPIYMTPYA